MQDKALECSLTGEEPAFFCEGITAYGKKYIAMTKTDKSVRGIGRISGTECIQSDDRIILYGFRSDPYLYGDMDRVSFLWEELR